MELRNWWLYPTDNHVVAYGNVYGSDKRPDGIFMVTSYIEEVTSKKPLQIRTHSGSVYDLIEPDMDGHRECIKRGCAQLGIKL